MGQSRLKIIITAGGTSEKIDNVRKIKNDATGTLGSIIAREFASQCPFLEKIYYVCENSSIVPELPCVEWIATQGVSELEDKLKVLLTTEKIGAVIHSMAVSDYKVAYAKSAGMVAETVSARLASDFPNGFANDTEKLKAAIVKYLDDTSGAFEENGKIGSNINNLMLSLKQTPKVIGMLKQLQPQTVLIGFKLLNGVDEQTLVDTAHALLIKNNCDFVLANDSQYFKSGRHLGLLISPDKSYQKLEGKEQIAKEIVSAVLQQFQLR
jgi:phosphopantothenate---cysteine ligase (CTP)